MNFIVYVVLSSFWIVWIVSNWQSVITSTIHFYIHFGSFLLGSIECILFLLASLLGYEMIAAFVHLKKYNHGYQYKLTIDANLKELFEEPAIKPELKTLEGNQLYTLWVNDSHIREELGKRVSISLV